MQIQIRLADSGRSSKLAHCETQAIGDSEQQNFQIDPVDQLLITKAGTMLQPNQRLEASSNQMRGTYVPDSEGPSSKYIQMPCLYVFNQRALRASEPIKAFNEEELMQSLTLKCTNTASLRNRSEHRPLAETRSKEEIGRLQSVAEDILKYSGNLLEHHEEMLSLAHRFSMVKNINEEMAKHCEYQNKACTTLFKCLTHRSQEIMKQKKALNSNVDGLAQKIEVKCRALEDLRKQPAPDKIESKTHSINATVFDLYFDEQKHSQTIRRTANAIASIKRRLQGLEREVDGVSSRSKSSKMHDERKVIQSRIKASNQESIEINHRTETMQCEVDSLCKAAGDRYQLLLEAVKTFLRCSDEKNTLELSSLVKMSVEEKQFGQARALLLERIQFVTTTFVAYNKQQRLNESFLRDIFRSCNKFEAIMEGIEIELKKLQKEYAAITKDCQNIPQAKDVLEALAASMKEAGRRRQFVFRLQEMYAGMNQLLEDEQERRKKYILHRKKTKIDEVISQLSSHSIPTIVLDLGNDKRLPKIDPGQGEEESDRTARREADLKRQVSKLKEKLQRYERNPESESVSRALQEINQLAADISNYKGMRESNNFDAEITDTKLANMEGILMKTTKICHHLYSRKLKEELKKASDHQLHLTEEISRLNNIVNDTEAANRRLREEVKELRVRLENENKEANESKKRSKVESAEMSRTKEDQLKGAYAEIGRFKEEVVKRDEDIRDLQRNIKSLLDGKKLMESELTMLADDKKHLSQAAQQSKNRIESLESSLKVLREEQRQLEKKLHTTEEDRTKLYAEVKEHRRSLEKPAEQQVSVDRIQQLEQENLQVREINEQIEIEFKCKEDTLLDRLQAAQDKFEAEQEKVVELSSKLRALEDSASKHSELITELKMMLGDKEVQLTKRDQLIEQLQDADKDDDDGIEATVECVELVKLREENMQLKSELEIVENELNLIIMKETFEVETQTRDNLAEDEGFVDIGPVARGKRMLFIPYSTGVYLPLAMPDSHKTQHCFSNTTIMSYRSNYFLDMGSLEGKTRDFLKQDYGQHSECSLVMISKVDRVRQLTATPDDNPFGLKPNEPYFLVEVERPEFIVGFEEEDVSLKNYAYI